MAKKVNFTFCELGGSFVCCFKATMCYTGAPVLYILKHLIQNVYFYFYKLIFIQAFIKYLCVHKHGLVSLCLFVCLTLKMILSGRSCWWMWNWRGCHISGVSNVWKSISSHYLSSPFISLFVLQTQKSVNTIITHIRTLLLGQTSHVCPLTAPWSPNSSSDLNLKGIHQPHCLSHHKE